MYTQAKIHSYVPKGEQVEIISQSLDGVCIIEHKGHRYPCRIELLSDKPPVTELADEDNGGGLL